MSAEHKLTDRALITIALVLLAGIVVLALGHFTGNRIEFYTGLLVILVGVLTGIVRIIAR